MGQFSLFEADRENPSNGAVIIPDDEWNPKYKLGFEKEMLGLYVSDHPLLAAGPSLRGAGAVSLATLSDLKDGSQVTVGGLVGAITRRFTRKGEPMLFFQLEDLEGSVEVVAFPGVVAESGPLVAEDAVLVVGGRLDHRGDEVKVIAKEIKELTVRNDLVVRLEVATNRLSSEIVRRLKEILSHHPGPAQVYLHMASDRGQKILRLADEHRVEPRSALYAELRELLGQRAVT
jgi:DNA polymerase-3 subunit alpha